MKIERVYTHKDHGHIGTVNLTVPDSGWELEYDGESVELDATGVEHLARFALQTLQDAYAGDNRPKDKLSLTPAEWAYERWFEKLDRILNGKIATRASGPRDPVRTMAINLAVFGMTGKTAKIRTEKAAALVDSTKPDGYWWTKARAQIAESKAYAESAEAANISGMVTKSGETVPESAESVGESAVAAAVATE